MVLKRFTHTPSARCRRVGNSYLSNPALWLRRKGIFKEAFACFVLFPDAYAKFMYEIWLSITLWRDLSTISLLFVVRFYYVNAIFLVILWIKQLPSRNRKLTIQCVNKMHLSSYCGSSFIHIQFCYAVFYLFFYNIQWHSDRAHLFNMFKNFKFNFSSVRNEIKTEHCFRNLKCSQLR